MARKAAISNDGLKGYLLEEVVASLIRNAGYRLITDPQTDPYDLDRGGNGLRVRGRGGFHQADVLGELSWAPAFSNPIRLFLEAKWRGNSQSKVGIQEVRHAVGIVQDVNQALVTVGPRQGEMEDTAGSRRNFCYSYRYALCSTSGFTSVAQTYALAHQIALIDLLHEDYDQLRNTIHDVGDDLREYISTLDRVSGIERPTTRPQFLNNIRGTLRTGLWALPFDGYNPRMALLLEPLIDAARNIGELFVGVSATGFVLLLKANFPDRMVRHMGASQDPHTSVHFERRHDGSFRWQITVETDEAEPCELSFALPNAMLRALDEKQESRRRAALILKEQHFSRLTVYRITEEKSLICTLKLNDQWLANARAALDSGTADH
jgi:hypothetical protein